MAWTAPRTWVAAETLTAALLNTHLRDNLLAAFPVGSLHYLIQAATTSSTTINGFALEANGTAFTRATYSSLNTLLSGLSYPFGSGDGSTTANPPDLQGRTLAAMASSGHADVDGLGDSDGLAKASRAHSHTHTGPSHTHGAGSYSASVPLSGTAVNAAGINVGDNGGAAVSGTSSAGGTGATGSATIPYLVAGIWAVKY